MGTTSEWLSILVWAVLFGGVMAWWCAKSDRAPAMFKPKGRVEHVEQAMAWILASLLVEIISTFHWRAIHRPLIFITLAVLAGLLLSGQMFRKRHVVS